MSPAANVAPSRPSKKLLAGLVMDKVEQNDACYTTLCFASYSSVRPIDTMCVLIPVSYIRLHVLLRAIPWWYAHPSLPLLAIHKPPLLFRRHLHHKAEYGHDCLLVAAPLCLQFSCWILRSALLHNRALPYAGRANVATVTMPIKHDSAE